MPDYDRNAETAENPLPNNPFDEFQAFTDEVSIYPDAGTGTIPALTYASLGLTGESGEVAEKVKKHLRDQGPEPEFDLALTKELGDVLFYVARVARERRISLSHVVAACTEKLRSRKARGKLRGSGDDR